MAIGYLAPQTSDFYSRMIIQPKTAPRVYTPPQSVPRTTTYAAPPRGVPTTQAPTTQTAYHPVIVTTTAGDPSTGTPATGDQTVAGTPPPSTTTTQTSTGNQTGSTGSTDTSRLIDLIAASFKPQDIGQTYGPQSVASDATASGGTNPMAVVVLAIVAMAAIFWYAHRKTKRAA